MRLIYCKSTEKRARRFQIYTCIMKEDNGQRAVIKKAVYSEGTEHIRNMYKNFLLLNKILPDQVVNCYETENGIAFPFIEGELYENKLVKKLLKNKNIENWTIILEEWKSLIIGTHSNICKFDNSVEFQNIFGNADYLKGDAALKITNFDAIGENIIVKNKKNYFIDYEWVFDFPIPIDFCFYRIIKYFYENHKTFFEFNKLLEAAGISNQDKVKEYERLLDSFNLYVSLEKKQNIEYDSLGKIFKNQQILSQNFNPKVAYTFPENEMPIGERIILYGAGDVGKSFYEELKKNEKYTLITWVDKNYKKYREYGYDVFPVDLIKKYDYDYILLAIYNENIAKAIMDELKLIDIDSKKIVWIKPQKV